MTNGQSLFPRAPAVNPEVAAPQAIWRRLRKRASQTFGSSFTSIFFVSPGKTTFTILFRPIFRFRWCRIASRSLRDLHRMEVLHVSLLARTLRIHVNRHGTFNTCGVVLVRDARLVISQSSVLIDVEPERERHRRHSFVLLVGSRLHFACLVVDLLREAHAHRDAASTDVVRCVLASSTLFSRGKRRVALSPAIGVVEDDMARCFEPLLEDALGEHVRWRSFIACLSLLAVVRVRVLQRKVVTGEHVVLEVHRDERRLQDGLELLRHVLPILTHGLLLTVALALSLAVMAAM